MSALRGRDPGGIVSISRGASFPVPALIIDPAETTRVEVITTSQGSRAWVVAALAMVAVGALFQSGPLFGLGLLLAVATGVAWLWARWCMKNLAVERRFSQTRAFWGEEVDMSQVFTNMKPLPVPWLGVEDQTPAALEVAATHIIASSQAQRMLMKTSISLGWYERITRHYTVRCKARGEHEFGPLSIETGDFFDLLRPTETIETPGTLLVYPRYVPLEQLGIQAKQPFGDI